MKAVSGVHGSLSRADDSALELGSGAFTIEAWVKPDTACLSGTSVIVSKWAPSKLAWRIYLDGGYPNRVIQFSCSGPG